MDAADEQVEALVIGAGPAGLAAAEAMSAAGLRVVIAEAMPAAGRKFLMAGKSGLNLTKDEPEDRFPAAYAEAEAWLRPALEGAGPREVAAWAEGLGQPVFTGSSGRVFPTAMKASRLKSRFLNWFQAEPTSSNPQLISRSTNPGQKSKNFLQTLPMKVCPTSSSSRIRHCTPFSE